MPRTDNTKIDTPDETVTTTEYGVLYPNGTINWGSLEGGLTSVYYDGSRYVIVEGDTITGRTVAHGLRGFDELTSTFVDVIQAAGGDAPKKPLVVKRTRIVITTKAVPL